MYENSRQNLICDDDIKVKSLQIAKESGIVNFICSRRWFEAFKNRSGLIKAKISEENDMVEIVEIEEVPDMPEKPRTFKKTRYWHKQNDELDTKGQFILDHGFAEECLVDLH